MNLRSPIENENGSHFQNMLLCSIVIPAHAESRFVLRRISLDTRFRGYNGDPEALHCAYHPLTCIFEGAREGSFWGRKIFRPCLNH